MLFLPWGESRIVDGHVSINNAGGDGHPLMWLAAAASVAGAVHSMRIGSNNEKLSFSNRSERYRATFCMRNSTSPLPLVLELFP